MPKSGVARGGDGEVQPGMYPLDVRALEQAVNFFGGSEMSGTGAAPPAFQYSRRVARSWDSRGEYAGSSD